MRFEFMLRSVADHYRESFDMLAMQAQRFHALRINMKCKGKNIMPFYALRKGRFNLSINQSLYFVSDFLFNSSTSAHYWTQLNSSNNQNRINRPLKYKYTTKDRKSIDLVFAIQ